jgi:lauroyl-KDO2-lipid IV(A) myristoyltransferase
MSSSDPVFDARFQPRLLHPRYWLSWLALGAIGVLAFVPPRWRIAGRCSDAPGRHLEEADHIARTNLAICFKEKSEAEREAILMTSIRVGLKSLLGFGEFTWRSPAH